MAISTKQRAPLFPPSIMANEHGRNPRSSLRFPFIDTCPTIFHELPPTDYLFQLYHQPLRSEKTTGRTYQMWPLWPTRTIKRSSPFFSFFCFFLVPSPDSKRFIPWLALTLQRLEAGKFSAFVKQLVGRHFAIWTLNSAKTGDILLED